jgi:sialidase-1
MNRLVLLITLCLGATCLYHGSAAAQDLDMVDVFVGGEDGYHTYRIPAVAATPSGTVLAFAEGRVSRSDHARNDIVLKRSTDNGSTWGDLQVVAADGTNSLNNPCVVVLPESGRVLLMFQRYPTRSGGERGVDPGLSGENICSNKLMYSDDKGATWSPIRDITATTKRPTEVTSIASGPGNGIVLRRGPHKGRIIFPFNQGPAGSWRVYAVFSDDGGANWSYGAVAEHGSPGMGNEVLMAELSDGRVRLNSRSHEGAHLRKTAVSDDGGETWSPLEDVPDLPEPQCNAGFLRFSDPLDGEDSVLVYTGPNSQKSREAGTVHLSFDEGETWSVSREMVPGRFAYSALTRLSDGRAGCLFETGKEDPYERIRLARFPIDWVVNGRDSSQK